MSKQKYLKMLEDDYLDDSFESKLEYIGEMIFDFSTYEKEFSEMFAAKAIEVCNAISKKTTFQYIEDPSNKVWYLLIVNMPFFKEKITWGTSIRGAWWDVQERQSVTTGIDNFVEPNEWEDFISAVIDFSDYLPVPRLTNQ